MAALTVFNEAIATVALSGDLDIFSRQNTQDKLDRVLTSRFVIVDLRGAKTIDATFLGQLAGLRNANIKNGGMVVLLVPSPTLGKLLHVVGFDRIFTIVKTLGDAYARFKLPAPEDP